MQKTAEKCNNSTILIRNFVVKYISQLYRTYRKGDFLINIAVCDDNPIFLKELIGIINKVYTGEHTIFTFSNAQALISHIEDYGENCIDIIVTDIEMPGMNGVNMAKSLKPLFPRLQFIFITNYTEYIQDVFSVDPIYYILKPVDPKKLLEALNKAVTQIDTGNRNAVSITSKNKVLRILFDEIKYVESYMRTILVHEIRRNTEILMKLDDFQKQLPSFFIRTHKSYLVNMNMIRSISNNRIELFSGEIVPVAKAKYPEIKKTILHYLGEKL